MERVEEYLEAIYDIQKEKKVAKTSELAKRLSVKPASVTEMLLKLKDKGYIHYQPYKGAVLTKEGEKVAKEIKKYHELAYVFFKALGVDDEKARKLACELEHHLSDETSKSLCILVANNCKVCEECEVKVSSLKKVKDGKYIAVVVPSELLEIMMPGTKVEVKDGKIVVKDVELEVSESIKKFLLLKRPE
ncbi:MAG: metal-dependent transcriptional regulator [Archaeoglobaceae archaeon]|nr:metal-dependent transcriptional regulator [Archaeoglobaceae archaeon]MCX8152271.1 metal-dependent transcriptional regulator [Archaeoglobaceae archaeon]MDW8013949.1 metal-dependent transcriptional regulator [Archaeoglobaceae archaeon]